MKFTKLHGTLKLVSNNSQTEISFEGARVPDRIEEIPEYVAQQIKEPLLGLRNEVVERLETKIDELENMLSQSEIYIETLEKKLTEQGSSKRRKTTQPKAAQVAPQA